MLAIGVVLLAVITVGNVLLTVALAQRLRRVEHGSGTHAVSPTVTASGLVAGDQLPGFTIDFRSGQQASTDYERGSVLFTFFSTTCRACHDALPDFIERTLPSYDQNVVAIVGPDDTNHGFIDLESTSANLVFGPAADELAGLFQANVFPSFYLFGNGFLDAAFQGYGQLRTALPAP